MVFSVLSMPAWCVTFLAHQPSETYWQRLVFINGIMVNVLLCDLICSLWQSSPYCPTCDWCCGSHSIRMLYLLLLLPQEEGERVWECYQCDSFNRNVHVAKKRLRSPSKVVLWSNFYPPPPIFQVYIESHEGIKVLFTFFWISALVPKIIFSSLLNV